ncbi:MAG: O-methyltransferase [bacterium]
MEIIENTKIDVVLNELFKDAKNDYLAMMKGLSNRIFRPLKPKDFKDAYLSISKAQGEHLVKLIVDKEIKNIVEFGTSFGISTLYLAKGILPHNGKVVTTELLESKAEKAIENFKKAEVNHLIEVRIGDAKETLRDYAEPIDLLLLDGWKDLYHTIFKMMEPNFHENTVIYVDNADMYETKDFLSRVQIQDGYQLQSLFNGKVVIIQPK